MVVFKKNIYLVGFMGTGKSTVGRELARLMGKKFIDMDAHLEKQFGKTVNEIFDTEGEEFFLAQELELAKELSSQTNRIVATGGCTILNEQVRELFQKTGLFICLTADMDQLVNRLKRTDKRPMLRGDKDTLGDRVEKLLEDRKTFKFHFPIRVDTTNLTPQEAARKIVDTLKMKVRVLDQLHDQYILIT